MEPHNIFEMSKEELLQEKEEQKSWLQKEIRGFKVGGLFYCLISLCGFIMSVAVVSSKITTVYTGILTAIHDDQQLTHTAIKDVGEVKVQLHENEQADKETKSKVDILYADYQRTPARP